MKSSEEKNLSFSLIETIGNSDATDLVQEIGEIAIDNILNEGILRDIPIINTFAALVKTGIKINDYLFIKKIVLFLSNLDATEESRQEFLEKMKADRSFSNKVGETILLLLDRVDSMEKPALVARLVSAYLNDECDYSEFITLSGCVERMPIETLKRFLNYCSKRTTTALSPNRIMEEVYLYGLSNIYFDVKEYEHDMDLALRGGASFRRGNKFMDYQFNDLANRLAEILRHV